MKLIPLITILFWSAIGCGQSSIMAGGGAITNPNIAAFPAPPSYAVFFSNLQAQSSGLWVTSGGTSCCGGSNTGTNAVTFANSSPSLTGSSIYIGATGNGYNVQAYIPEACAAFSGGVCSAITHIQADAYIDIVTLLQGQEGPDVTVYTETNYQVYPSVQCATNPGSTTPTIATWNLWGEAAGWVSTNQSCATYFTNTGKYQHVQWLVVTNFVASPPTLTYSKLYVQNHFIPLTSIVGGTTTFNATSFVSSGGFKPQAQVDSPGVSVAAGFYIDAFNVAAW